MSSRHACGTALLGARAPFWDAVHLIDPEAQDEALLSGAHEGHLTELFEAAGLRDVVEESIAVDRVHPTFEEWWEPYTYGVGPAGDYVRRLDEDARARLETVAREHMGDEPAHRHRCCMGRARDEVTATRSQSGIPMFDGVELVAHAILVATDAAKA